MTTYTKTTCGLAIFVLMLTGAITNAQSASQKSPTPPASPAATDSAANQNRTRSNGSMQGAQSNPMYKENKNEGTNPLYERDSAAKTNASANSATASHEVVEYKDPEDRTTRYRPGNNKTTKVKPTTTTTGAGAVEYKDGEDGTMHTQPGKPK